MYISCYKNIKPRISLGEIGFRAFYLVCIITIEEAFNTFLYEIGNILAQAQNNENLFMCVYFPFSISFYLCKSPLCCAMHERPQLFNNNSSG